MPSAASPAAGAAPPRRVVVKLGTGVLTSGVGRLDSARIAGVAAEIAALRARGTEVIVVSSGAVGLGIGLVEVPEPRLAQLVEQGAQLVERRDGLAHVGDVLGLAQGLPQAAAGGGQVGGGLFLEPGGIREQFGGVGQDPGQPGLRGGAELADFL